MNRLKKTVIFVIMLTIIAVCIKLFYTNSKETAWHADITLLGQSPTSSSTIALQGSAQHPLNIEHAAISKNVKIINKITNQKIVTSLLKKALSLSVGQVEGDARGMQKIVVGDRAIFEGYHLQVATMSGNGVIALASYNAPDYLIDNADISDAKNGIQKRAVASIWVISPSGDKTKITSPNLNASNPSISADGTLVAFTGEMINTQGLPSAQSLYLAEIGTGYLMRLPIEAKDTIAPLFWEDNVLVIYNGDESGGEVDYLQL